jgi:DIM1 family U5 snRNP protein
MSFKLPHLNNGCEMEQSILNEEDRLVVIRFGMNWNPYCMQLNEVPYKVAEQIYNWCVICLIDIVNIPSFNTTYELKDPVTVKFFYRNKRMMTNLGMENNNKIYCPFFYKQEFVDNCKIV